MTTPIKRQLSIFLIVGLITILIDFLLYRGLLHLIPSGMVNANLAKGISFIAGTIFAYFANRFWTFNNRDTPIGNISRFILVYIFGLCLNILVNHLCTGWLDKIMQPQEYVITTSFLFATIISANFNFIGMKFFVFTSRKREYPDC
jgi:putative flippase GtrA